ncbi:HypC/HybG/HupF family hydrogenase formation chaperone [Nocardia sp. NEAU-G5]|uniref:HypC/HybG/HupF family hydrogenase formation chaperone n=1 Tax=Nocardia albiluteola TaxID=2842303 RepID=A0ABS6B5K3_9NOCA|nr:HypC/HybG/HupF family hydrogenase formation chaperone [Nocardia albiluteola]MBU3062565.1 HypC/HybG/HupF family hydrogenase formation chaperone [Nocardia albiluteola]MBU3065601.1 HypC/HybG/HupF family hydrogenase formation chaperone [Nocardia albiluteola]
MCLGIPGRVVEILDGYHDQVALVDVSGERRRVNIGLLEENPARPGDWVIIHMGLAVEKTDADGAAAAMAGLRLLGSGEEP